VPLCTFPGQGIFPCIYKPYQYNIFSMAWKQGLECLLLPKSPGGVKDLKAGNIEGIQMDSGGLNGG
jgi:hypothetical protein